MPMRRNTVKCRAFFIVLSLALTFSFATVSLAYANPTDSGAEQGASSSLGLSQDEQTVSQKSSQETKVSPPQKPVSVVEERDGKGDPSSSGNAARSDDTKDARATANASANEEDGAQAVAGVPDAANSTTPQESIVIFVTDGPVIEQQSSSEASFIPTKPEDRLMNRSGYEFLYWTKERGGDTPYNFDEAFSGTTYLYAKWAPVSNRNHSEHGITVRYIDPRSTNPIIAKVSYKDGGMLDKSDLENTKFGDPAVADTVRCWYYFKNGHMVIAEWGMVLSLANCTQENGNYYFDLYVDYKKTTYTVSFMVPDGAGGYSEKKTYEINSDRHNTLFYKGVTERQILDLAPTPDKGYYLVGWNTKQDGSGSFFSVVTMVNADISLYPIYAPIHYKITYNLFGGTRGARNPITYTVVSPDITLADPVRAGYSFLGWFTDATFTTKVDKPEIKHGSVGNKIFYAKWSINSYTVVFKDWQGKVLKSETVLYGSKTKAPADPVRADDEKYRYTFAGWSPQVASVVTGDTVYVARWNATKKQTAPVVPGSTTPLSIDRSSKSPTRGIFVPKDDSSSEGLEQDNSVLEERVPESLVPDNSPADNQVVPQIVTSSIRTEGAGAAGQFASGGEGFGGQDGQTTHAPFGMFGSDECSMHYFMLAGVVATAVYALGVVLRRRRFAHALNNTEETLVGKNKRGKP